MWEQKFPGEPWNLEARKHGGQQAEHQNGEFALIVQQSSAWEKPIGNYCYNARLFFLRHEGRIQNRKWEYEREKEKENTRKWFFSPSEIIFFFQALSPRLGTTLRRQQPDKGCFITRYHCHQVEIEYYQTNKAVWDGGTIVPWVHCFCSSTSNI